MKRQTVVFFILRLFFYFSVTGLVLFHPGISVSFDRIGLMQWFVIIPLQALIAFFPIRNFTLRKRFITAALSLLLLSTLAGGFGIGAFQPFIAGLISFLFTFLLFNYPRIPLYTRLAKLTILEPFFLAWICLRLLDLSRSGEDIAGQSMALTQFIFAWAGTIFLLHNVVIYFCLYPKSSGGVWKEGVFSIFAVLAVLVVVLVILPPNFVSNKIIENLHPERVPKMMGDDSDYGIPEISGRKKSSRNTIPQGRDRKKPGPGLRGVSENEWRSRFGRGGDSEDNRQYMVMVVASKQEPVYMGNSFRGKLDPVEGFLVSPEEPLNNLANQRFFVTWYDNKQEYDIGRERNEVFALSTLPQKYLPYRPVSIDPTIQNEASGPLRYIHQVVSNIHSDDPLRLINTPTRYFSDFEEFELAPYLELPLEEDDIEIFSGWLNTALKKWQDKRETVINKLFFRRDDSNQDELWRENEYIETILAIMINFSEYQYNLNYNDDSSIDTLKNFLINSPEGDCVEFSNSLALLGRLAGIPSRVVTGYLAAESLQTAAHLKGLSTLQRKIPVLQQFSFNDLYMVTNLHSHSWTQFYIPDYGWLDFEATAFSIPPEGMGDFNTWDVVIPLFDDDRVFSQLRKFPWLAVLKTMGFMALVMLFGAYALLYGRTVILYFGIRRGGRAGARSLYLLLLARLASDGKPIKPASKTALEYSELFPGTNEPPFETFASLYTELRWKQFKNPAESEERFRLLKLEYRNILSMRKRGPLHFLKRIFSLRGIAYL
jgi:hypothetical protein